MRGIGILVFLYLSLFTTTAHPFAVATPSNLATEAAIEVLNHGGNAMDALVAASFTLNVTAPHTMGIGGGGFLIASKRTSKEVFAWDSREQAPASAHEKMFYDAAGNLIKEHPDSMTGPNPVGVPGMIDGIWQAHRKLGSKPWAQLISPAIKAANNGFPVSWKFEEILSKEWPRISPFPVTASLFGDGHGSYLKVGRTLRNPLMGQTLQAVAKKGGPEFYTGKLAQSWLAAANEMGVKITAQDLKAYKTRSVSPIAYDVFGMRAFTMTPPSSAGLTVAGSLRYLDHYYRQHNLPSPDSPERIVVTFEALRHFQLLRAKTMADPPFNTIDPQKWIGSVDEQTAWKEIDEKIKKRLERFQTAFTKSNSIQNASKKPSAYLASDGEPSSHTAHISIVDDQGMSVSYTATLEELFGSGLVVTGHGFILNNELSDFNHEPGHPNSPAAGKRPRSNMSPHLLFDKNTGQVLTSIGCAGGPYIPTMIVLALENFYLHKMSAREAVAFTRFHPSGDDKIKLDRTVPEATLNKLKEAGFELQVVEAYGRNSLEGTLQAVFRRSPKSPWEAASEPRSDGLGIAINK